MKVNVVDAGCGIGKTTALINKMNEDTSGQKYLFVTPFLSEVERIKKACPNKNFVSPTPNDKKGTKIEHLTSLIREGKNIVTTHALFKKIDEEAISIELLQDYILVMDEVADVVDELPISKSDLKLLSNKITVHPRTHMAEWNDEHYQGAFDEYKKMIKMNNVFAYADKDNTIISLMWMFPYKVFKSFKEIYVLTYMFDGQIQKRYFDYFGTTYTQWYVKNYRLTPIPQIYDYTKAKSLIRVCSDTSLNEIGNKNTSLSLSWFARKRRSYEMIKLQNNIYNFFRSHTKANSKELLWTTFKEYRGAIKRKGFTKSFAPINSRATNEYSYKRAIAYIGNRYFKPTIKNFFTFNNIAVGKEFEDKFALSELVQFIYRSAIRNNKPIDVYIPSKRMRTLFLEWLKKPND